MPDILSNFLLDLREWLFGPIIAHELGFKIFAAVISPILISLYIYLLYDSDFISEKWVRIKDFVRGPGSPERAMKIWRRIEKRLQEGGAKNLKEAVLEADRVLHHLLDISGYSGKTVDEILEKLDPAKLSNLEDVKRAHKIRDKLVRNPAIELKNGEAKEIISVYQKTFEEWGLLD